MGKWRWGVILDAGSSGTRIYIYRWLDGPIARQEATGSQLHTLPALETKGKWTKKTHPGISTFGETPGRVGPDHLEPLLRHALEIVPDDDVESTPVFLLGTAGMRLLPDHERNELLDQICSYTRAHTKFLLPDCNLHIQVIPGETEGLYGWIAANYLIGGFDARGEHAHGKGHHTYGFLDMGGASAQIAFAPNATEAEKHANDLRLLRLRTIDGLAAEYRVFVTTWLGFGVNEARRRYIDNLVRSVGTSSRVQELPDPCLPTGLKMTLKNTPLADVDSSPYLLGTGNFAECLRQTYPLLDKDAPCEDQPCLLHGVHVPAIDFDVNHFIGISEYWHTTHEIFEMSQKDKSYDFNSYQKAVRAFCSRDWIDIRADVSEKKWGKKVDEQTAYEVCFKASWLINVLHDGIGIPRIGLEETKASGHNGTKELLDAAKKKGFLDPFQPVNKIQSTEVSWTLGKMVLYASSQVPPQEAALPVGFGSNVPGVDIPADFQSPGGARLPTASDAKGDDSLTAQFKDTLFNNDSPRRIPGFLVFLFIIGLVAFFLCGRERRERVYRKIFPSSPGKTRHSLFGKIPFLSRGPAIAYERVLESGLEDPNDFELGDFDSDESDQMMAGSGSPRKILRHPRMLDAELMDRSGILLRTESRERLGLNTNGRKSRPGSPTRMKGI